MVDEVTSLTFGKSVREHKGVVVVDFWAPWCVAPNATISVSHTDSVNAFQIKEKDCILSFDGGLKNDVVLRSKTTSKGGHCKKVVSSTGRFLETTDDHTFFTRRGWVRAEELRVTDDVAVLPVVDPMKFEGRDEILLNQSSFDFLRNEYRFLDKYVRELEQKGLLPLKKNDVKLLVITRLVGALFSDGSLYLGKTNNYREISFTLGDKKDVKAVVNDLKIIGFDTVHVSERTSACEINGRKFLMHGFKVKCLATSLYLLFRVLGVPEGNKTNQAYGVPEWIVKSENAIKKEFLSAYLGGDGPRVTVTVVPRKKKQSHNRVAINSIEFHKREDLVNNGVFFAHQIAQLLSDFGVTIAKVFYEIDPYIRKDATRAAIISIRMKSNVMNGFILTQKIGYAYCWQKQVIGMYSGEFLRELLNMRNEWSSLYERVISLGKKGHTYQQVGEALKIRPLLVYTWLVKNVNATVQKHHLKFDTWLSKVTKGLTDGFVWEKIKNVSDTFLPSVQVISTGKYHNFVANGFLVHNCGPCKMLGPVIEKLAPQYKKIKFVKVNVDECSELAQEFGVMGIPCLVFFRDGDEVERVVGFNGEDALRAKLNAYM